MQYDIIIVGAGSVGLCLAALLAQQGVQVALIEAKGMPTTVRGESRAKPSGWVSAISAESRTILQGVGGWPLIDPLGISPYSKMTLWDEHSAGEVNLDAEKLGHEVLGHIIDNSALRHALFVCCQRESRVDYYCPETVENIEMNPSAVRVKLSSGQQLSAALVVGADGAQSRVRQIMGGGCFEKSYQQQAIVAAVKTEQSHEQRAWQRFSASGPLAFLPLLNAHHSAIVWSAETKLSESLMAMDEAEFCQQLSMAFSHRLGRSELLSQRLAFPLMMRHAINYTSSRLALIGDAAHRVHPLAGQGLNLGIQDAACLADHLLFAKAQGRDLGGQLGLRRYSRQRKAANWQMQGVIEACYQGFRPNGVVLPIARGLLMRGIERSVGAKRLMVRFANSGR